MTTWQPIETAPKDGSRILLWEGIVIIASWDEKAEHGQFKNRPGWQVFSCWEDQYYAYCAENPTYWMPLPEPPK